MHSIIWFAGAEGLQCKAHFSNQKHPMETYALEMFFGAEEYTASNQNIPGIIFNLADKEWINDFGLLKESKQGRRTPIQKICAPLP